MEKKFYTDNDLMDIIKEVQKMDFMYIDRFLESKLMYSFGSKTDFLIRLRQILYQNGLEENQTGLTINIQILHNFINNVSRKEVIEFNNRINNNTEAPAEQKKDEPKQVSFEGLFYDQKNSEIILNILKELKIINANNEYIGKNKGMFPKILRVLSNLENKK